MELQTDIAAALRVRPVIDVAAEVERRRDFLVNQMQVTGQRCLVLGISGGVDSTVAGRLCQLAVEALRERGEAACFVAMRLPYGTQRDEADAQQALRFIQPDEVLTVDIRPAADGMLVALEAGGLRFDNAAQRDFIAGNIKARQRMIAQYAVAAARGGLVVGTDQAAEALMGFFTKFGDGACDVAPLVGLTKRQVRAMGRQLEAPAGLVEKLPTADLETLDPGKSDEVALGVPYTVIDDFLEGRPIPAAAREVILATYRRTEHKRHLPITPGMG